MEANLAIDACTVVRSAWKVLLYPIGTYLGGQVIKLKAKEGAVLIVWVFEDLTMLVVEQVKLDPEVLENVAFAFVSIVLINGDLLFLARAVLKVATENYHTLEDRDVDEERANHSKPSFVRSLASKMDSYGMPIDVYIEQFFL